MPRIQSLVYYKKMETKRTWPTQSFWIPNLIVVSEHYIFFFFLLHWVVTPILTSLEPGDEG